MNSRIGQLLSQITALEDELRTALHEQESHLFYQFKGRRVEFKESIRATHRKLKRGILRWIVTDRPQNFVTGPIIYSLVIPLVILDVFVTTYQAVCFPIYRIAKVPRGHYIALDRQHLEYLNWFERFHCSYCAYANGLLAYASEISARTEQYFCPIKHARRVAGRNNRYERFLEYGDSLDYHAHLEEFRRAMERDVKR